MKAPSERHLEDWIVANFNRFGEPYEASASYMGEPDSYWLNEDEFILPYYPRIIGRQIPFAHGILDLLVDNHSFMLTVVEIKRGAIDAYAAIQCMRYINDLNAIVRQFAENSTPPPGISEHWWEVSYNHGWAEPLVHGCLVGHSIEDLKLLGAISEGYMNVVLYDYDEQEDGYTFDQVYPHTEAWKRRNEFTLKQSHLTLIHEATTEILKDRAKHAEHQHKHHSNKHDLWKVDHD